jgi:transposase
VTGVPGVPSAEELSALPAAELAVRLAEAYRLIAELTEQAGQLNAQAERLSARVGELERQARRDSSTSSRPPSSDCPYKKKKSGDRSLRERGKRRPGKQPGDPGATMNLVDDPDESIDCPPAVCCGCGTDLAGAPVTAWRRHQVTDIEPAPAPKVTEYVAQAKECAGCGETSVGELPAHVRARASYGPETCAQAANLVSGHHMPIYRATLLLCQLAGVAVSTGWMAGIRGRAAGLVESGGFTARVRELLKEAAAARADETPARAAGGTRYVHLACTRYLTCMHTGDRSADAIDSGGVLPGYEGVIVRDGYAGYGHLTSALHAWCGVHLLRT